VHNFQRGEEPPSVGSSGLQIHYICTYHPNPEAAS